MILVTAWLLEALIIFIAYPLDSHKDEKIPEL